RTLRRAAVGEIVVVNRSAAAARRVAAAVDGRTGGLDQLPELLPAADLVVCSTAARETVIGRDMLAAAAAARLRPGPLCLLDLAVPHDVDLGAAALGGTVLLNMDSLGRLLRHGDGDLPGEAVAKMVDAEVADYLEQTRAAQAVPTIVALQERAAGIVGEEMLRLSGRLQPASPQWHGEVETALRRVAEKLLHHPTVRAKALAGRPEGWRYVEVVRHLFALDDNTAAGLPAHNPLEVGDGPIGESAANTAGRHS
ncbi:hypothetical protein AB0M88_49205, partial [Actinoplanes sp. NPDC051411]